MIDDIGRQICSGVLLGLNSSVYHIVFALFSDMLILLHQYMLHQNSTLYSFSLLLF